MDTLSAFFILSLAVQIAHSIEELSTGFHRRWYLFKMSFRVFFLFEVAFLAFWLFVLFLNPSPTKTYLQASFLLLMFANGVQHLVWWGFVKKYVPGLIAAPVQWGISLVFFFSVIF